MTEEETINERVTVLAQRLEYLKEQEAQARVRRIETETNLAHLVGVPLDGSETHDFGEYKITVKQPINRTIDQGLAAEVVASRYNHPFSSKFALDLKAYNAMQANAIGSDALAAVNAAITSKPGKVAVAVKRVTL